MYFPTEVQSVFATEYRALGGMLIVCNVLLPGHRIRVEITSSCSPRWDVNPNTGSQWAASFQKSAPEHLPPLIECVVDRLARSCVRFRFTLIR
jgi:hypothetical protein